MALIKCPECGHDVSPNAVSCPFCGEPIASKMQNEVESGTEIFHVEGRNRLELSAKADAEINYRTNKLSQQGKIVVNVQKSEPQAFTLGVTLWKMDITLIWNANLASSKYKETIYQQAMSMYHSGNYAGALNEFEKLNGYSDSIQMIEECQDAIEWQHEKEEYVGIDQSSSDSGSWRYLIAYFCVPVGIIVMIIQAIFTPGGLSDSYNFKWFIGSFIVFAIGVICLIWNFIQHYSYKKRLMKYNAQESKNGIKNTDANSSFLV